jgi:hypothetical protein
MINVETFDIVGSDLDGGNIVIPCVFDEGICPEITPSDIQKLDPVSAAIVVNTTIRLNQSLPFLQYLSVALPMLSLDVDIGGKDDSVTLSVEPITFDVTDVLDPLSLMIYTKGSINDWSALFRALYTYADDGGGEIVVHGTNRDASDDGKVSPISSVLPRITIDLETSDFDFELPDIPLPYIEEGNDAQPWLLVGTKSNYAKFLIQLDFVNPTPVAIQFVDARARVYYTDDTTNEFVEVASILLPDDQFVVSTGNNTIISYLTLNANSGTDSCMKSACVDKTNLAEQLECVPCTSTKFLRSFLSRDPTVVTVVLEFKNLYNEVVNVTTTLTLYSESDDSMLSKGRKDDFIDTVVDVESILSRALYFELNMADSIIATLTPPWIDFSEGGDLIKVDGGLDITVDNIFTFSFETSKLFIRRVGMSDLDGVIKTYPLTGFPLNFGTQTPGDDEDACMNVADGRTTFIPSGEVSDVIKVPIRGSLEALSRAVSEMYVQGRFCLHITEAMADMSLQCEDALLIPYGLECENKDTFGLTLPWSMPDVNLFRKHACHSPASATKGCVPETKPIFDFDGAALSFSTSKFTTAGSAAVTTSQITLNTDKNQAGTAFLNQKVMVKDGFEITFEFKLGDETSWTSNGDKAGGFALVIQDSDQGPLKRGNTDACSADLSTEGLNDPLLDALADTKTHISCAGYKGIENSVGIIFSIKPSQFYDIIGLSDWERGSVSVWKDGNVVSGVGSSGREADTGILGFVQIPEDYSDSSQTKKRQLDNFNTHLIKVVYNSVWRQIYIYYDDMENVFLNAPVDLSKDIGLGSDGEAYVGFTSQMDYKYSQKITSFKMGQVEKDDSQSRVVEDGQERSSPGKPGVFRVDARDSCGLPRTEGGESVRVSLRGAEGQILNSDSGGGITVKDTGDGLYECHYTADQAGDWEVLVGGEGSETVAGKIVVL